MDKKVIASDLRIKRIKNVEIDIYLECKGLLTVIYHHAKEYDGCLELKNKDEAKMHLEAIKILGRIFNATVEENFNTHDKLCLIGEAQAICLRVMQETKDEYIKRETYQLLKMYARSTNELLMRALNEKNTPAT
jgi:hypothetical protein